MSQSILHSAAPGLADEGYRSVLELVADAVVVLDPLTGALVDANRAFRERHGYTLDELRALGLAGLAASGDDPSGALVGGARASWRSRSRGGETIAWELRPAPGGDRVMVVARETRTRILGESGRVLFDATADAICVYDMHTLEILDTNRANCELHGYTVEEIRALGLEGMSARREPYTPERAAEYVAGAAAGIPQRFEWATVTRGGDEIVWETQMQRATLFNRDVLITAARDIRDRKAAEEALRESEVRFRELFEEFPLSIQMFAPDGRTLRANRAWERLFSVSIDAVRDWNPLTEPQLAPLGELLRAGFGGASLDLPPSHFDPREAITRVAGEETGSRASDPRWIQVSLRPLRGSRGEVSEVFLVHQDVTALKEAQMALERTNEALERHVDERTAELAEANEALEEEVAEHEAAREELLQRTQELEAIFQALPDLYFRMEPDGRVVDYRANAEWGLYVPPSAFLNRRLQDIMPAGLAVQTDEAIAQVRRTGKIACIEYQLPVPEGLRDYEARIAPLADGDLITIVRDITDRKQAERALQEREEHFRTLIENSHDIITILDHEGRMVYQSASLQRIMGYAPEELDGVNAFELVHPDDTHLVTRAMADILRVPGTVARAEYRFRHKNGEWRRLETFGRSLPEGSEGAAVFNSRDVTERREAEQALRGREEHFRRMIENASDMVQVVGADTRIVYTGPSLERLLGYTPEEIQGTGAMDYLHPDDIPGTLVKFGEMLGTPGVPVSARYRIRHKDGRWRDFEAQAMTLASDSAAQGVVVNARDVTERLAAEAILREREEHFRALIEGAQDNIVIVDSAGTLTYQSPSVLRILGYHPEELVGHNAFEYIHPDDAERVAAELANVYANPGWTGQVEYRFRHKDGSWRRLEAFGRILATGSSAGQMVANVRDVTERREQEEALRVAKAEAESANLAKSEFLSRMSHELRTPLNSILGFAQILAEVELAPADLRAVNHILTAGEHLLNLINEVLDIARIESGRQPLSLEPVSLANVLAEAVGMVRPLAAARGVRVVEATGGAGELYVHADKQRLAQVLLNLLSNAVKYNRPGGSVRLLAGTVDGRVRVRVQDTGLGIAAEHQGQLFVPFARLGAEQSGVEGTGLGLALSRRLVEAMGGVLELETSSPDGSTFRVELRPAEDPAAGLAQMEPAAPEEPQPAGRTATLLYVEDNLANLSLVETILARRSRWRLIPALQGGLGIEMAREHRPDVILLDLHLPDLAGDEVLRQLRADPRTATIPVIIISADATPNSVARLRAAGANDYLTKPLNVRRFVEAVEAVLPEGR